MKNPKPQIEIYNSRGAFYLCLFIYSVIIGIAIISKEYLLLFVVLPGLYLPFHLSSRTVQLTISAQGLKIKDSPLFRWDTITQVELDEDPRSAVFGESWLIVITKDGEHILELSGLDYPPTAVMALLKDYMPNSVNLILPSKSKISIY